jgi:hypothetical protein
VRAVAKSAAFAGIYAALSAFADGRAVDDQLVTHVLGHRPADDHPLERILDGGEI